MLRLLSTASLALLSFVTLAACASDSDRPPIPPLMHAGSDDGPRANTPSPGAHGSPAEPDERAIPDDESGIPCAARAVLQTVCQQCHARPHLLHGAPFPLVRRSDILAE